MENSIWADIIIISFLLVGFLFSCLICVVVFKPKDILCWLGYHRTSLSEISYDFDTRVISLHCKGCQKVLGKVKHETELTDEQYVWFKRIFEGF